MNGRDPEHRGLQIARIDSTMLIHRIEAEARILVCTVCCKLWCPIIELIS